MGLAFSSQSGLTLRKEESMMETENGNLYKVLGAFLIGGAVGAAAGFLLAARSGEETRNDLIDTAKRTLDNAKQFYSDARTQSDAILQEAMLRADKLVKEADHLIQEGREKAARIIGGKAVAENGPGRSVCIESPEEIIAGLS
jgi:gas vesicle protein